MSIKNLYLPAQSGKIRMENGVYCGLKGVKSMIEVIYKEETDTTKETAEYVKPVSYTHLTLPTIRLV